MVYLLHQFWNLERLCDNVVLVLLAIMLDRRRDERLTMPAVIAISLEEHQHEIRMVRAKTHSCSIRVLAVTAIIGTCPSIFPSFSRSRIRRVQARPSIIGISKSMRMRERFIPMPDFLQSCHRADLAKKSRASPPWLATCTIQPALRNCLLRTF